MGGGGGGRPGGALGRFLGAITPALSASAATATNPPTAATAAAAAPAPPGTNASMDHTLCARSPPSPSSASLDRGVGEEKRQLASREQFDTSRNGIYYKSLGNIVFAACDMPLLSRVFDSLYDKRTRSIDPIRES
uniref:Uncharacterized protein n=1 Tax=Oryza nivara TaxID=4536 RepID=A0A0E0HSS4_ORYNI